MRKLKINCIDFEPAFELSSYETTVYLDTETGALIFVEDYVVGQLEELLPTRMVKMLKRYCGNIVTYPRH